MSLDQSGSLTYAYAQTLYLSRNDYRLSYITGITQGTATPGIALVPGVGGDISGLGALSCTSLTVNGSPVSGAPAYVDGINPGTAAINKALVLDGSGNIATINNLTATTISGTLATASQPNITSLGTLSSLTVSGNITGTIATAAQPNITSIGTLSALTVSGNINGTLATAAQPNITSLGTLTGLTIAGNLAFTGASRTLTGLNSIAAGSISGTLTTAAQPNITSLGTLSSLTATSITGTLQTAAQPNITSIGTLGILDIVNTTNPVVASTMDQYGLAIHKLAAVTGDSVGMTFGITSNSIASVSGGSSIIFTRTGSNGIGYLTINHRLSTATSATHTEIIRIDQAGDVSISNGNLTVDSTKKINGFLGYGNQPVISTVGALTELGIGFGTLASTEYLRITGDGTNYLDGNYTRCCLFQGSNTTPLQFQIEIHNGTKSTSTNASWIGNITANDLRFGTNNTTYMFLQSTGRLGIGTTSPQAWVEISGSVSSTIDAAGLGYGALAKAQTTFTIGPLASVSVSLKTSNSMLVSAGSFITTSDRRLKTNIEDISDTNDFVRNVNPKLFSYRSTPDKKELGYIAQDVARYSVECISFIENESLKAEKEGDIDGVQLTLDYPKIACLLHKCLQDVLKRLDSIEAELDELRAIMSE